MDRSPRRVYRRVVAAAMAACLVLSAPGLPAYQALALEARTKGPSGRAPLKVVPVLTPGLNVPLNPGAMNPLAVGDPALMLGTVGPVAGPLVGAQTNAPSGAQAVPVLPQSAVVAALGARQAGPGNFSDVPAFIAPRSNAGAANNAFDQLDEAAEAAAQISQPRAAEGALRESGMAAFDGSSPTATQAPAGPWAGFKSWAGRVLSRALPRRQEPPAVAAAEPPAPVAAAPQASPAELAQWRAEARVDARAEAHAELFAGALSGRAKGGGPVRRVYAFFNSNGELRSVSQSGSGQGISLELTVGEEGSLAVAADAAGRLSPHNVASRGQFKSRRLDGFGLAVRTIDNVSVLLAAPAETSEAPVIDPDEAVPGAADEPTVQAEAEEGFADAEPEIIEKKAAPIPTPRPVRPWYEWATIAAVGSIAGYIGVTFGMLPGGIALIALAFVADKALTAARAKYVRDSAARRQALEERQRAESVVLGSAIEPETAAEAPAETTQAAAAAPAAAASESKLPRSWAKLPEQARQRTTRDLVEAKRAAQARARRVAADAQLVGVSINLDDPSAHWSFTFHSKAQGRALIVYPKRVASRAWPAGKAAAPLHESRLARLDGLDRAYAQLKASRPVFVPARVDVIAAWKGDASYRFTDARGKTVFVGGTPEAIVPSNPAIDAGGVAGEAASYERLPAGARADVAEILAAKATAQRRVRARAADARLIGMSIDLADPGAGWNFAFESRSRRTAAGKSVHPPLWESRLRQAPALKTAYTALKRAKPWFKPVRAELKPAWNAEAVWVFTDASGRTSVVEAKAQPSSAPVAPEQPSVELAALQEAPIELPAMGQPSQASAPPPPTP